MKADFQKITSSSYNQSFINFWVKENSFGFHWHYHPEVEICYVKKGSGKRIIGDNISDFIDGDLVLVGSELAHSWITSDSFNKSSTEIVVSVIQFQPSLISKFDELSEFKAISDLLQLAKRGIYIQNPSPEMLSLVYDIHEKEGLTKLLLLFNLLHLFSQHEDQLVLNDVEFNKDYKAHQEERIQKVCQYIHENYKERITISQLAELVYMESSSFCRFFKKTLGKTVVSYINDLRISYICNEIQSSSKPFYKLAYEAGFSSIAHFNKQFKLKVGMTPKAYKEFR